MSTAAGTALPSGSSPQEKVSSRNKRKYRADTPSGELSPFGFEYPMTADYVGSEFMAAEKAAIAAAAAAAAGEGVNLDILQNMCDTCSGFHGTAEELLESHRYMNWSHQNEVQLEEVLLKSLDATFDNAVSVITAMGYSEAAGRAAVVRAARQYSWKESLGGFGEAVVDVLKTEGDMLPRVGASLVDMRKVERSVLDSLVAVVGEAQPFYTTGDVMFCLLMSDMNVAHACTVDYTHAPLPAVGTQVIAQPVVGNYEPGVSSDSDVSVSITNPQTGVVFRGKLTPVAPKSFNPLALRADSSTISASPNLSFRGSAIVAAATQSSKDDKPFTSKRGNSKRDSSHRQKFMSFDKSSRAMGSKGSLRYVKHNSLGSAALDRKCRQLPDSSVNNLKGSSKVIKGFLTGSEVSLDLSFNAAGSSTPALDTNKATSSNPLQATSTDLSLSLSSSSDISVQSLSQDSSVDAKDSSSKINFSYDENQKAWIPQDRKDEIVLILVQRQKEMQAHMQDWTDWAQEKVMQVARRLAKEKEELQSLRKEKEELDRLQEERHLWKRAIGRRIQLEAAKRHAIGSVTKFEELSRKHEKTLKRSQYWESERAVLQDMLAAEKSKLSRVLQQLQHAKEKKEQLQAKSKQEETAKIEAIACVSSERKEREHIEMLLRSEENLLHLKAENDMQRCKSEVRALEQQISKLKVSLDSGNVAAPRWGTDNKSYAFRLSEGRKSSNSNFGTTRFQF
ncbi:hypothetical protein PR202_gb24933 [Eleusine coracana subsp. coracana]|uniref:PIR2-like helical domain-containing protein n=1 Tax=Eleusine coracana subsp. coracana TaxID=191504 RepID=A0AAV5FMU8_ELECO|nr:hypothetical protein PR202_gb24933 [Eleusine coracana subsp. coracana]